MFRHLSPKGAGPKLPHSPKSPVLSQSGSISPKAALKAPEPTSSKDLKSLNSFLGNKHQPLIQKKVSMPVAPGIKQTNTSSQMLPQASPKVGNVFDDYYEKRQSPVLQHKPKKEEISVSGDSYQSEGYKPLKKGINTSAKSIGDNVPLKSKNLVVGAILSNQEHRGGFKSPPVLKTTAKADQEESLKRIVSFGGKRATAGRILSDENVGKPKFEISGSKPPSSPQAHKSHQFSGLNLSDKKARKEKDQLVTEKTARDKAKKVSNFLQNVSVKSSPFLNKMGVNSSNELSGEYSKRIRGEKEQGEGIREKDQSREQKSNKSLSFNKGEMFLRLKKRQDHHNQICKQMNTLGVKVGLLMPGFEQSLQFLLVSKINQSKNTTIYLGQHPLTRTLYCLKKINTSHLGQAEVRATIEEHKIHSWCQHPHIVRYFCSGCDRDKNLFQVMEFMEEGTLGFQVRQQVLSNMSEQNEIKAKINQSVTTQISKINKIRRVLYEIFGAVAYLHQKGIVHRDIKPDNIFVSHETYKLGDFGSASYNGSQEYVGTLDYAAPEILTQQPYDSKVDVWSLGCLAYELDVGRSPFFHINPEQTKRLASKGDYDRSLISDGELRSLVERMLVASPAQRIHSSQLLKHCFFSNLRGELL